MGIFSISFQIGAMSEVDDAESNSFVQEFLSNTEEIDGLGIFQNNSFVATAPSTDSINPSKNKETSSHSKSPPSKSRSNTNVSTTHSSG